MRTMRIVLHDQISMHISSLEGCDKALDTIVLVESDTIFTEVKHHKKKIVYWLSCMRHFANVLKNQGFNVQYVALNDPGAHLSLIKQLQQALFRIDPEHVIVTEPSDYSVHQTITAWCGRQAVPTTILDDDRFLCSKDDFKSWVGGKTQLRMEYFYRTMRKKHDVLMDGEQPLGGQWNFDHDNRSPLDKDLEIPPPYQIKPDSITQQAMKDVEARYVDHFGDIQPFGYAVTHEQAQVAFEQFIHERLALFGRYQDAMLEDEPWLYHSHIGLYLNNGLLDPLTCIRRVEKAYRDGLAPLNSVEGFIRQILGWREYVRGIYWQEMPAYATYNFFNAKRDLPDFYWDGNTPMNCLHQCVSNTKEHGYAHHIQRLMVLGNFALLAGIDPKQVNTWFWIVYMDAYQWVELPNVSGMTLFADGGYLASKPYASGGNYIAKMSNYCKNCTFNVREKTGPSACPFNYLYWDFLARNRDKLADNQRVGMMYRTYDRMDDAKKKAIKEDSEVFLSKHVP